MTEAADRYLGRSNAPRPSGAFGRNAGEAPEVNQARMQLPCLG